MHIFNYQYIFILSIILLDIILAFSNITICPIPKLSLPINFEQTILILISTLTQSIYPLPISLDESVSTFHSLFVSIFINYEV